MGLFELANRIKITNPSPHLDADYGPFSSIENACNAIPIEMRAVGRTVLITTGDGVTTPFDTSEYWWRDGVADNQLIKKIAEVDTSSYIDKMLHYWNNTTKKWVSASVEWVSAGILKMKAIVLTGNSENALPNELGTDGINVVFGATKRKLRFANSSVFTYTPTGNFTISQVKAAMESAGYVFNGSHIIVILGSNNYTCTIDVGAANPYNVFTITREGSGLLSFASNRTLNVGIDGSNILSGGENSIGFVQLRSTTDYLSIKIK